ncbi:MAG: hypothetical protein OXE94_10700 [Aestuariivita sp.]|nr:hypothetical protein [Aestuariivita sp.]MCY4203184.1 hypothetical protein [Aestuariivita sp.]
MARMRTVRRPAVTMWIVVANALVWEQEEVLRQRDEQLNQKEDQLRIKNAHIGELEEQRQREGERLSSWRGVSG